MSESQLLPPEKPASGSSSSKVGRPGRRRQGKPPRTREPLEEVVGIHIRREQGMFSVIYTKTPLVEVERSRVRQDAPAPLWVVLERVSDILEHVGAGNDIS